MLIDVIEIPHIPYCKIVRMVNKALLPNPDRFCSLTGNLFRSGILFCRIKFVLIDIYK